MTWDVLFAYMPFFDPINLFHTWWMLLAVPMVFFLSMTYKAMRYRIERLYWRHVLVMTIQILLGMVGMLLGLYALVEYVVPML